MVPLTFHVDEFCKGKKDGHYQFPANCAKFYQCSNGRTFVMPCPTNTWFSLANDTCEYPDTIKPKPNCTGKELILFFFAVFTDYVALRYSAHFCARASRKHSYFVLLFSKKMTSFCQCACAVKELIVEKRANKASFCTEWKSIFYTQKCRMDLLWR